MKASDKTRGRKARFVGALQEVVDAQASAGDDLTPDSVLPKVAVAFGPLHWMEAGQQIRPATPFQWPASFLSPLVRHRPLTVKQLDRFTTKLHAARRPESRRSAVIEFGGAIGDPAVLDALSWSSERDSDALVRGMCLMALGVGRARPSDELLTKAMNVVGDAQSLEPGSVSYDLARGGAGYALLGSLAAAIYEHRVSVVAEVEHLVGALDPRPDVFRSTWPRRQREALLGLARRTLEEWADRD